MLGETIKLVQELKHCSVDLSSLTLTSSSLGANGVQLVYEDDGWSLFSSQVEGVSDHFGTVTDVHLHELWTGELEEGSFCLSSASSGHQGLACAWWSVKEESLGRSDTDVLKPLLVGHW